MESKEITQSLENIKQWLVDRKPELKNDPLSIKTSDLLKSLIDMPDIVLDTYEQTLQDQIVYSLQCENTQKAQSWTELSHQLEWIEQFSGKLYNNRRELATIELLRMNREHPITLATYHVEEAINIVRTYANMKFVFGLVHPDTDLTNIAADSVLVESSHSIIDIIREVFMRLSIRCCVRLVVKSNNYHSALLISYLVDMMLESGASDFEIQCYGHNRRDSAQLSEHLSRISTPNKASKLSVFAMVFTNTDLYSASRCIIESYFRELYPNLIVLVEESAYEKFSKYWQHYYSQSLLIGSRLDDKATVIDTFNDKVYIDLMAIDVRQSHKTPGNAINVLRFRTVSEALGLINQLRKIPLMSIWNDDVHLSREFASRINQCDNFWFNYMPRYHHGDRFAKDTYDLYRNLCQEDMVVLYNNITESYGDKIDELQKTRANFMKKQSSLRYKLVMQSFVSAITKVKSLRNGGTVQDALCQMQIFYGQTAISLIEDISRVETYRRPIGLAIIYAPEETTTREQKTVLFELVIKNLIIGNAVLLNCFQGSLGAKFQLENDHVIPFVMVTDKLLHLSTLSLDDSSARRKLPKDVYAITHDLSTSSQQAEALILALGTKAKQYWTSNMRNADYWSDE